MSNIQLSRPILYKVPLCYGHRSRAFIKRFSKLAFKTNLSPIILPIFPQQFCKIYKHCIKVLGIWVACTCIAYQE